MKRPTEAKTVKLPMNRRGATAPLPARPDRATLVTLPVLGLVGAVIILVSTARWGAGISRDSISYVRAARGLVAGQGLNLMNWPPVYSVVLAGGPALGLDAWEWARWVNAILFGLTGVAVGLIVQRYTASFRTGVAATFLFLTSAATLTQYAMVWSEPLFLLLAIVSLALVAAFLDKPTWKLFVPACVTMGLSLLTRYAAAAFVGAASLMILLYGGTSFLRRLGRAVLFGLASAAPLVIWMAHRAFTAGSATGRPVAFHMISYRHVRRVGSAWSYWLLPAEVPPPIRGVFLGLTLLAVCVLLVLIVRRKWLERPQPGSQPLSRLPALLFWAVLFYGLLFVVIILFFDHYASTGGRIQMPVFVLLLIVTFCLGPRLVKGARCPAALSALLRVVLVLFLVSNPMRTMLWSVRTYRDGLWYASPQWKESKTLDWVRSLPKDRPVYTNAAGEVAFFASRPAWRVPVRMLPAYGRPNPGYQEAMKRMGDYMQKHNGVIVYFNTITWRWFYPTEEEIRQELPVSAVRRYDDATVYAMGKDARPPS